MIYRVRHCTTFEYEQPVTFVYNLLHLKPRPLPWQTGHASRMTVLPEPVVLCERRDFFGNIMTYCSVEHKHDAMRILIESEIEVLSRHIPPCGEGVPWNQSTHALHALQGAEPSALQFSFDSRLLKRFDVARDYAMESCHSGRTIHAVALDLMQRIHSDFTFDPAATNVTTPVAEVFRQRKGVCQDFAHLMICCLRSIGIAARYNSGYIQTVPPPGKPRLQGADASHAWVGAYCPKNGWLDLDPTNNKTANEEYITIGWGRDYSDVCPVKGVLVGGGEHRIKVEVDMIPEQEYLQSQQQQQ